jgi:hypothetical protein
MTSQPWTKTMPLPSDGRVQQHTPLAVPLLPLYSLPTFHFHSSMCTFFPPCISTPPLVLSSHLAFPLLPLYFLPTLRFRPPCSFFSGGGGGGELAPPTVMLSSRYRSMARVWEWPEGGGASASSSRTATRLLRACAGKSGSECGEV